MLCANSVQFCAKMDTSQGLIETSNCFYHFKVLIIHSYGVLFYTLSLPRTHVQTGITG